ncbi:MULTISPECIES: hypothetical protein [unclassified Streptomyces]|uniref:hypothetical protein n=1 Tax=unclassified Streptomyces TaxID=2593676 RepID=UPI00341A0DD5
MTTQGTDGCGEDPAAMNKRVRDRMDALGLQLEFRFVGYRVPVKEQEALGKACDLTTYESSAGLQLTVSDHPSAMEGYGVGLGESETAGMGEAVDIPTGVPGLSIGTIRDTSGPEIKAWLQVLRTDKRPATSNLLCLLPKEQADICTASLVFFFLRQAAGTDISTADRDRVTAAVEAYVKSLP